MVFVRRKGVKSSSTGKDALVGLKVYSHASIVKKPFVMNKVIAKIQTQWQKEWENQIKQLNSGQGWMES